MSESEELPKPTPETQHFTGWYEAGRTQTSEM